MHRTLVSPAQLDDLSKAGGVVIVDCRFSLADPSAGRRQYDAGHVPAAVYAHLDDDLSGPVGPGTGRHPLPDPDDFARVLGAYGVEATRQVVAYDDAGGAIAARLWWTLRWLGHDAVAVLDGGYSAWVAAGLPVSTAPAAPTPAAFAPRIRSELVADAAEVGHIVAGKSGRLVDAREPERFRGEREPIDRVAGRIPGSVNLPFRENLEGGTFRSPGELRARFATALEGVDPDDVIVYCGSGVTACHDLLAAAHAGIEGWRLYAGSYSEWIADERRPVERG